MSHGIAKLQNFEALSATFPDPLGVGSRVSLVLAVFGEVVCAAGCVAGLLYRLALIPMVFTMCVAFFAVHGGDSFAARELALVYLVVFVLMYAAGPGATPPIRSLHNGSVRRSVSPGSCRGWGG